MCGICSIHRIVRTELKSAMALQIDSCRCSAGHAHKGGQCVSELPGGASATAAGGSSRQGTAAAGGIKQQDAAFERYNQMCKGDHRPYAEFDGVDSCKVLVYPPPPPVMVSCLGPG